MSSVLCSAHRGRPFSLWFSSGPLAFASTSARTHAHTRTLSTCTWLFSQSSREMDDDVNERLHNIPIQILLINLGLFSFYNFGSFLLQETQLVVKSTVNFSLDIIHMAWGSKWWSDVLSKCAVQMNYCIPAVLQVQLSCTDSFYIPHCISEEDIFCSWPRSHDMLVLMEIPSLFRELVLLARLTEKEADSFGFESTFF